MNLEPTNFSIENLNEMKTDFRELRSEIQLGVSADPDYNGEADVILFSIDNLLEELDLIKSPKDIDLKKKVKIDALLFWVSKFLPAFDEDFEDDEDFEYPDDDDEIDYFFDQLEISEMNDLPNQKNNNKNKPKSSPPKKNNKKK